MRGGSDEPGGQAEVVPCAGDGPWVTMPVAHLPSSVAEQQTCGKRPA
jgi:hypothetical protein